jgi:hypothetical protein
VAYRQIIGDNILSAFFKTITFSISVPIVPTLVAFILVIFIQRKFKAFKISKRKLQILKATYGTDTKKIDITDELNNAIANDKLKISIGNEIAGDPHRRELKKAIVKYIYNKKEYSIERAEYEVLQLPSEEGQNGN